jgi:hypothetical protein
MICQFCQQDCKAHKHNEKWFLCETCKVFFNNSKREIVFRPNSETHLYWLFIDQDENTTKVDVLRNPKDLPPEDQADMVDVHPRTILQLDHALQGVTPENMYDKLKLLLVFS